jgi:hypothetical protein
MSIHSTEKIENVMTAAWSTTKRSKRNVDRLRGSLEHHGQVAPLVVRRLGPGANHPLEVIDGSLRLDLLRELGVALVDVVDVGGMGEAEARELHLALNLHGARREADAVADALEQAIAGQKGIDARAKAEARLVANLPIPRRAVHLTVERLRNRGKPAPQPHNGTPVKPWIDFSFKVPHAAGRVIDDALTRVENTMGAKRPQALEYICADYLAGAQQ